MTNTLLITGASGYVGRATVAAAIQAGFDVVGAYHRRRPDLPGGHWAQLDLADTAAVHALVARWHPCAVIHAAAAWGTPEEAQATIVAGTTAVEAAAHAVGARLIHLSSDVIFDGEHAPYREADPPAPITFYAAAKAAAEGIVAAGPADHVIVRTSLVTCFDPPDPRTALVINALQAVTLPPCHPVTLFTDEYRCPVRTADLTAALVELVSHPYRGVIHVAGPERMSRYELGRRIAAALGIAPQGITPGVSAASGLVRPRDCTLDISLARAILRTPLLPLP